MARANVDRTLEAILNSRDRAQAKARLQNALRRTWAAGNIAGFADGQQDATDDSPAPRAPTNPYPKAEGS